MQRDASGAAANPAIPRRRSNSPPRMEELTSTENRVSFSRRLYNDSVMFYNTQREVFPSNIIAGMFNFVAAELFVIEHPEQREPTKVSLV